MSSRLKMTTDSQCRRINSLECTEQSTATTAITVLEWFHLFYVLDIYTRIYMWQKRRVLRNVQNDFCN